MLKRKPAQFTQDGEARSNYLPGYIRISYVDGTGGANYTYKFLVSNRGGTYWNQAFVVYQKYHNVDTFVNDVFDNHPDLITKINNDTTT